MDEHSFGAKVGAYLAGLRAEKSWSREHTAALIRERTGGTTTTNTYRRWEKTGDVSIVDLEQAIDVLGGSLAELVGVTGNGEQLEGEQPERPDSGGGFDPQGDPRERSAQGGLERPQSSGRGARRTRRDQP